MVRYIVRRYTRCKQRRGGSFVFVSMLFVNARYTTVGIWDVSGQLGVTRMEKTAVMDGSAVF